MKPRLPVPMAPLEGVYAENGFSFHTDGAEPTYSFVDLSGLVSSIRTAVVLKRSRLTAGEITYLRRRMDIFQHELAERIGTSEQSVQLWEAGRHRIPNTEDAAIRATFIAICAKDLPTKIRKLAFHELVALGKSDAELEYVCSLRDGIWHVATQVRQQEYRSTVSAFIDQVIVSLVQTKETHHQWIKAHRSWSAAFRAKGISTKVVPEPSITEAEPEQEMESVQLSWDLSDMSFTDEHAHSAAATSYLIGIDDGKEKRYH